MGRSRARALARARAALRVGRGERRSRLGPRGAGEGRDRGRGAPARGAVGRGADARRGRREGVRSRGSGSSTSSARRATSSRNGFRSSSRRASGPSSPMRSRPTRSSRPKRSGRRSGRGSATSISSGPARSTRRSTLSGERSRLTRRRRRAARRSRSSSRAGEHRLARWCSSHYRSRPSARRTGSGAPLLRVLDVKASLDPEGTARLAALAEALTIASRLPQEQARRSSWRRAASARRSPRGPARDVARAARRAGGAGVDAKRLASLSARRSASGRSTSNELSALAKRVGEAHAASGDGPRRSRPIGARSIRAVSGELLGRVDELLRDQGNPVERVELYRAALARGVDRSAGASSSTRSGP